MLTESLTVSITADSSGLEAALARLAGRIAGVSESLGAISGGAGQAATALAKLGEVTGVVGRLSTLVQSLAGQLTTLSATPVTLDTTTAVASLQQVTQAALSAAAAVAAVGAAGAASSPMPAGGMGGGGLRGGGLGGAGLPGGFGGGLGGGPPGGMGGGSIPRLAGGGRVEGPGGIDRVPAMLTRGEFVVREPAARRFPPGLLERLNAIGPAALATEPAPQSPSLDGSTAPPASAAMSAVTAGPSVTAGSATTAAPSAAFARSPVVGGAVSPTMAAATPSVPSEAPPVQLLGDITVQVTTPSEIDQVLRELELSRLRQADRFAS